MFFVLFFWKNYCGHVSYFDELNKFDNFYGIKNSIFISDQVINLVLESLIRPLWKKDKETPIQIKMSGKSSGTSVQTIKEFKQRTEFYNNCMCIFFLKISSFPVLSFKGSALLLFVVFIKFTTNVIIFLFFPHSRHPRLLSDLGHISLLIDHKSHKQFLRRFN